jgi:hypothetical protein
MKYPAIKEPRSDMIIISVRPEALPAMPALMLPAAILCEIRVSAAAHTQEMIKQIFIEVDFFNLKKSA